MKSVKYFNYPKLRREYASSAEMGEVINRKNNYMSDRLTGKKPFTFLEKKLLLEHIGKTAADIPEYFPEGTEGAA